VKMIPSRLLVANTPFLHSVRLLEGLEHTPTGFLREYTPFL
jgi:hypothetical protein